MKSVITKSISCNSPLNIALDLLFNSGIPAGKTIKGVFDDALKNGLIRNLTTSNTKATFTYTIPGKHIFVVVADDSLAPLKNDVHLITENKLVIRLKILAPLLQPIRSKTTLLHVLFSISHKNSRTPVVSWDSPFCISLV